MDRVTYWPEQVLRERGDEDTDSNTVHELVGRCTAIESVDDESATAEDKDEQTPKPVQQPGHEVSDLCFCVRVLCFGTDPTLTVCRAGLG